MVIHPAIEVANLGMADSLILMVLALVVFGPRRLPQIGRQIGKLMYEFRKASNDFKFQMEEELRNAEEADRRKKEEERLRALAVATPAIPAASVEAVSQAPEAVVLGTGEPSSTEPAAESPYPSGVMYPPISEPETPSEAQADGTPHGEDIPRILPPSTGEVVPASPPASHAEPAEVLESSEIKSATGSAGSLQPESDTEPAPVASPKEAPMFEATPVQEQAAHHG